MSKEMYPVGFIIPAKDEAERIGRVIDVINQLPEPYRPQQCSLVVVDDGSRDNTSKVAQAHGAYVIRSGVNYGKGKSMETGLDAVRHNHRTICYLDADLKLTVEHVVALIEPVLSGKERATIGVFSKGRNTTTLAQKIAPGLSGQRCIETELLEQFESKDWDCRFGIELALNTFLDAFGVVNYVVEWPDASHAMKEEKSGFWYGFFVARAGMYKDIFATWRHKQELMAKYRAKRAQLSSLAASTAET